MQLKLHIAINTMARRPGISQMVMERPRGTSPESWPRGLALKFICFFFKLIKTPIRKKDSSSSLLGFWAVY